MADDFPDVAKCDHATWRSNSKMALYNPTSAEWLGIKSPVAPVQYCSRCGVLRLDLPEMQKMANATTQQAKK